MRLQRGARVRDVAVWDSPEDEGENWMLSYADLMTLLFAFFALLISFSEPDPVKLEIVAQSVRESMTGEVAQPRVSLADIQAELEQVVRTQGLQSQVSVSRDRHGVALSLLGSSSFGSGSAGLLPRVESLLDAIAKEISRVPHQIAVEGHTDNLPISSSVYPSNWELSSARASSVVGYFIDRGVPPQRLRAVGYADTRPVDPALGNRTAEARARNRRVVILFLDVIG